MASTRARTVALGVALAAVVLLGAAAGVVAGLAYYNHHAGDWRIGVYAVAIGVGVFVGVLLLAACAWGVVLTGRAHFDAVRLIGVLVTVLLAAATAASTTQAWFTEEVYGETLGYDTNWGKAALGLAILGGLWALAGGFFSWRLLLLDPLLGLASVAVVAVAGVTHNPKLYAWEATSWYWAALGVAIGWTVTAAFSAWMRRKPGAPSFIWLYGVLVRWLSRDRRAPSARVTLPFVAATASAVLVVVGACGPWLTVGIASASGLDNSSDGNVILILAFFALLALLAHWRLGSRVALLDVLILGVIAAVVSIQDLHDLGKRDAPTGWGINLAAEASVGVVLSRLPVCSVEGRHSFGRNLTSCSTVSLRSRCKRPALH
jgi:hypothetical protein